MDELPSLIRSTGKEIEGAVSVGASSTLASTLLGPFVEACRAALPKVTLRCFSAGGTFLKGRVEAHSLHLALAFEDEFSPVFSRRPIFRQSVYLVRHEPFRDNPASISLRELTALPLVLPAAPNVLRSKLDRVFADAGLAPYIVSEADVMSSTLSAVQAGIGGTILPNGDFADVPGYENLFTTLVDPPIQLTASVLWSAEGTLAPAAAAVRDLLVNILDERFLTPLPPGAERIVAARSAATADRPILK